MTKLKENFKYERLLEQAGVTNISTCYRDHANLVQCKHALCQEYTPLKDYLATN